MDRELAQIQIKAWYHTYSKDIYRYIFMMVGSDHLAKDLMHDTFFKAYKNYDSFDDKLKEKQWLFTIARNVTIDHIRKTKPLQYILDSLPVLVSTEPTPQKIVELGDAEEMLYRAIKTLQRPYQDFTVSIYTSYYSNDQPLQSFQHLLGLNESANHQQQEQTELSHDTDGILVAGDAENPTYYIEGDDFAETDNWIVLLNLKRTFEPWISKNEPYWLETEYRILDEYIINMEYIGGDATVDGYNDITVIIRSEDGTIMRSTFINGDDLTIQDEFSYKDLSFAPPRLLKSEIQLPLTEVIFNIQWYNINNHYDGYEEEKIVFKPIN